MHLKNRTPFSAQSTVMTNEDGIDTLYTIVRASLVLGKQWVLADEQVEPQAQDEYWGEPDASSLKYSLDFHTGKAATDVIIMGDAVARNSQPVKQLDVSVMVGSLQKTLRVYGDRYWHSGNATFPEDFQSMPLVYENAFGGAYCVDNQLHSLEQRNPVGKGFRGRRPASEMEGLALPNIEDPRELIVDISDAPKPAGFGVIAPHWLPRANYRGTFDANWQQQRAPFLPLDYDKRFQNTAHSDLIYPGFLQGGEEVKISNMNPQGDIRFLLPHINIKGQINVAGQKHPLKFNMETLIIETSTRQIQMVWKSAYICNNNFQKIRMVDLALSR